MGRVVVIGLLVLVLSSPSWAAEVIPYDPADYGHFETIPTTLSKAESVALLQSYVEKKYPLNKTRLRMKWKVTEEADSERGYYRANAIMMSSVVMVGDLEYIVTIEGEWREGSVWLSLGGILWLDTLHRNPFSELPSSDRDIHWAALSSKIISAASAIRHQFALADWDKVHSRE